MFTEEKMLEIIRKDPGMLRVWCEDYPDIEPTQAVYEEAVSRSPRLLKFVPRQFQTEQMCINAVSNDCLTLRYVFNQTRAVVEAAFAEYAAAMTPTIDEERWRKNDKCYDGYILYSPISHLKEKSKENLLIAVKSWGYLINEIPEHLVDDDILNAARNNNICVFD